MTFRISGSGLGGRGHNEKILLQPLLEIQTLLGEATPTSKRDSELFRFLWYKFDGGETGAKVISRLILIY